jgi:hypothetical protein
MTPHNVWENSNEEVIYYQYVMSKEMQTTWGVQFKVYPLQGNHDVWPVNVQSFNDENIIIKNLTSVWNFWLGDKAINTFSKAGYYDEYLTIKG